MPAGIGSVMAKSTLCKNKYMKNCFVQITGIYFIKTWNTALNRLSHESDTHVNRENRIQALSLIVQPLRD